MNFKFKTFSMLVAGLAMGLTACNNDDLLSESGNSSSYDGRYMHITAGISLPTAGGTRSQTDDPSQAGNGQTNSNGSASEKPADDEGGQPGSYDDFEYGYDYENEIRTMILVFADKDNNYLTHSVVTGITKAPTTGSKFDLYVTAEIKHGDLEAAYAVDEDGNAVGPMAGDDQTVNVYAICNYTSRLLDLFENGNNGSYANWYEWTGSVTEEASPAGHTPIISNTIWAQRSFLMTNAEMNTISFPATLGEWDKYADKDTPYDITHKTVNSEKVPNPIKVERTAARFDFRDGSPKGGNTYPLKLDTNGDGEGDLNLISVELTRMSLVNMSKNFYYFRRVSNDGLNTNATLLGAEVPSNWVVDTDAQTKSEVADEENSKGYYPKNAATAFNFPLYTADGTNAYNMNAWYVDDIVDVLKGEDDTWEGPNKYQIWRYVTENTIPTIDQQKTIQSTGVVFKGKIIAGEDTDDEGKYIAPEVIEALSNVTDASPNLYSYEGRLFAQVEGLLNAAVIEGTSSPLCNVVDGVLAHWTLSETDGKQVYNYSPTVGSENDNKLTVAKWAAIQAADAEDIEIKDLDEEHFMKHAPQNDITVYRPTNVDKEGWGYYCYFFYWNRHNDNLKSGQMGQMEFATVRNNVYKLAVTGIGRLGHPRFVEDDPDPVEPEDPDEDPTNYIRVQVEVLPWVVRENNITF